MPPERSEEPRSPAPPPNELREFGVAVGVSLAILLIPLLLWDWFQWLIMDSGILSQDRGLGQRPTRPQRPLGEQVIAVLLCLLGTIVLAKGRRVDRPLNRWLSVVLFVLAGALLLWVGAVGSQLVLRVLHLLIALGCFGLAAYAYQAGSRP